MLNHCALHKTTCFMSDDEPTARIIRPCNSCHLNSAINTFSVAAVWKSCQRMYKKKQKTHAMKKQAIPFFLTTHWNKSQTRRSGTPPVIPSWRVPLSRRPSDGADRADTEGKRTLSFAVPSIVCVLPPCGTCWVWQPVARLLHLATSFKAPVSVFARTLPSAVIKKLTPTKGEMFLKTRRKKNKIVASQSLSLF